MPQLPIPPIPVMPPEGGGPIVNPATPAQDAEMSPTAMIQNYLAQRGYQPTSENVSRALQANARDPGVISGLRSDTAATNDPTGGGRGPGLPIPPIPPTLEHTNQPTPDTIPPDPSNIRTPGTGGGGMGLLGTLATMLGVSAPGIAALISSGRPPPPPIVAPAPATPAATAGSPTTSAPPQTPQEAALSKATGGAPVQGVNQVDPNVVAGRSQGPTTPTAGAEPPMMPPLRGAQPPPPPPMQPGVARTQAFRPRIPIRPPIRVPF